MDTTEVTPRKPSKMRRFLRSYFGRAVIGLILIFAISSWHLWQAFAEYQKEERIAEKIWNAGGGVGRRGLIPAYRRIISVHLRDCKKPNGLPENVNELRHLQELNLTNYLVTDADLEHLRGLNQLEDLWLRGTQISDSGLENLRGLTKLRRLDLSYTQISDAGLEHLKGMNISELCLGETAAMEDVLGAVSEAALEHLKGMTNLKRLIFFNTPTNRAELQKALPNCKISP